MFPRTTPTPVRWYHSREVASPHTGRRRPTRAFWSWPRHATFRSAGRAGRVFVTTVRAVWFRVRSPMDRSHSRNPPTATFSFAAHNRLVTSSLIYESWPGFDVRLKDRHGWLPGASDPMLEAATSARFPRGA